MNLETTQLIAIWFISVIVLAAVLLCAFALSVQYYWYTQTKHIPPIKGQVWSDGITHYEIEATWDDCVLFRQRLNGSIYSVQYTVTQKQWTDNLNKNKLYLLKE